MKNNDYFTQNVSLKVQLKKRQYQWDNGMEPGIRKAITWNNDANAQASIKNIFSSTRYILSHNKTRKSKTLLM